MNRIKQALEHITASVSQIRLPTLICARSFFNGAASRRYQLRRAGALAATALCLLIGVAAVTINTRLTYAVYVNGAPVGAAGSISEAKEIVKGAEAQLSEIFGYTYSLENTVSVAAALQPAQAAPEEIENAILASMDGVSELFAIEVNGVVVGASEDEAALIAIQSGILDEYTTENSLSVRFLDTVSIARRFVGEGLTRDPNEIRALLSPSSGSEHALTVENIESAMYTEVIPFTTDYVGDPAIYEGDSVVSIAGEDGQRLVTENAALINGEERFRELVGSITIKQPVTEVVATGLLPRPATASYGEYLWPTDGHVTSAFGYRSVEIGSSNHQGLDIAGAHGQSIYAADGGEVIFAGEYSGYGLMLQIQHDNGDVTYYAHCSKLIAAEGERVARGQEIALMGRTGVASGVHCHFEIRVDGTPVDPERYLP
ncbi:MAG: peptidoglycan DD-metalloendopeptidase family protein [Oscillospiraceae bacterium]|jgi:murein DD-endopeptidase MepM/ murein hydrolase activator NlpD|nr:peptidoglycan DD-metalloendopeptidase family protein [Oscillospiraceae bacterium]